MHNISCYTCSYISYVLIHKPTDMIRIHWHHTSQVLHRYLLSHLVITNPHAPHINWLNIIPRPRSYQDLHHQMSLTLSYQHNHHSSHVVYEPNRRQTQLSWYTAMPRDTHHYHVSGRSFKYIGSFSFTHSITQWISQLYPYVHSPDQVTCWPELHVYLRSNDLLFSTLV